MRKGDDLPQVEKLIDQAHIERYARASGDYNPIHIDQEFAASTQFGGVIAHGMMIAAAISEMMTAAFGRNWADTGKTRIRFRSPVRPGQTITAQGRVRSVVETGHGDRILCSVSVVTENGETAIAGQAEVTAPNRRQ